MNHTFLNKMLSAPVLIAAGCCTLYFSCSEMNPAAISTVPSTQKVAEVYCPWNEADIGSTGAAGSSYTTKNLFIVTGSGADIYGTSDAFHFVYKTLNSNGQLIMAPQTITNTNSWAKAGLMIRETLDANSKNVFVAITPQNGITSQYRSSTGGATTTINGKGEKAPYYLKIVRNGTTITTYKSANGTSWTTIKSVSFSMNTGVYIGMAVSSHAAGALCTSNFLMATPPTITKQPENTTTCPTGMLYGFYLYDDGCGSYSYQWYKNGVAVQDTDDNYYYGSNSSIIYIRGVPGAFGTYGNYYCRINYLGMTTQSKTVTYSQRASCP